MRASPVKSCFKKVYVDSSFSFPIKLDFRAPSDRGPAEGLANGARRMSLEKGLERMNGNCSV
jgi:hypothetical protein